MANTLRFKRGLVSGIPTAALGEPLFTTDTFDLYIGNGTGNTRFQKYIASGTTSQILRGDGSLYTFPLAISSPSAGQVLKYNGTSWVNDSDAGITGSGAAGQVAFFTGATTQSGSNNLFWDNTNKKLSVGLNTSGVWSSYNAVLQIGQGFFTDLNLGGFTQFGINSNIYYNGTNTIVLRTGGSGLINFNNDGSIVLGNGSSQTAGATWAGSVKMQLFNTGNLRIQNGGTFTDSGQRLQVTGDAFIKGSGNTLGTAALTVQNSDGNLLMSFNNSGYFLVGPNNQRSYVVITDSLSTLGLQTLSAQSNLTISNTRATGFSLPNGSLFITRDGIETTTVGSQTTLLIIGHRPTEGFAPTSGTALFTAQRISPIINQVGSTGVTRGLLISPTLTAAADWRSIEWSNNSGWGLYGAGSAPNYLNGPLSVGTTATIPGFNIVAGASIYAGGNLQFISEVRDNRSNAIISQSLSTVTTNRVLTIGNATYSNVVINNPRLILGSTTDNGLRFQVTGDGYFSGSVGIGTTSLTGQTLAIAKNITGNINSNGVQNIGVIQSDVTASVNYFITNAITAAASFTLSQLRHYIAVQGTFGAGSAVTNQFGFIAHNSLTGATNNYGFYGDIASGTGRWNLYMNGTAANFLNGNTGIGAAPSAWGGSFKAIQVNTNSFLASDGSVSNLGFNYFFNGTNPIYISSTFASLYQQTAGQHRWYYAPIGTAGNTVSFTQAMTLDASGNLGLGTASPTLFTGYTTLAVGNATNGGNIDLMTGATRIASWNNTASFVYFGTRTNIPLVFTINGNEAGRFTNTSNLLIGTTTDAGFKLDVNGTMRVSGASTFGGNMTLSLNQNAVTSLTISNTTDGTTAGSAISLTSDAASGTLTIGKRALSRTAYKILGGSDAQIYNSSGADISILNDAATGSIKMAAGGSSTAHFTIASTGAATFSSSVTAGGNLLLTSGTASSVGAINLIRTGTSPVASRLTFGTDGTGYSFAIGKNQGGTITDLVTILDSGASTFVSSVRASGFNSSGGNGYQVINTASNTVTALRPTGGGTSVMSTNSNGLHIAVGTEANGDLILATNNTERIRLYRDGYLIHTTATNPASSSVDAYLQYSADVTAGNAAPHFRTENGAVIKLYQETTAVGNAIISLGGGNAVLDDTTFDGYTLRQIVKALRNQGILA